MCDFKVGDEVVCVDAGADKFGDPSGLIHGSAYTVEFVGVDCDKNVGVVLAEVKSAGFDGGYLASRFRKVRKQNPRLTIESFLTIKPGFEEPRRVPNKTPVRA